jgi:osmotically-inducible protein OsmY
VITQNGVVYLMGRVTGAEATRASNLVSTSQISGIQKVVKVFETISQEDLQRLVAPALR